MNNTLVKGAQTMGATSSSTHPYNFNSKDMVVSILALGLGFLFWQWNLLSLDLAPTLGVFIFFTLVIGISYIYMRKKGVRQNRGAVAWMSITIFATSYFLIFDNTPIHFFMSFFVILSYIMWIMTLNETSITAKLNGFVLGDMLNQIFVVPFANFTAGFRALLSKDRTHKKTVLSLIIGIAISIPLIFIILNLLAQADYGFNRLVENILEKIWEISLLDYIVNFMLGIPVALYCYGFIYGNYHKRMTDIIKYEKMNSRFTALHAIPRAAIYGPITLLNIIYIIFFIAMGSYLFSAFSGDLPASMTYAEYARKGFFELCGVATINLIVIAFSYTVTKRREGEYPIFLKLLTGMLSFLTALLVATAMSKMLMYISSYGLTQLRIFTLWFMVVIMFTFILLLIWHLRKYNLGKPLIIGCVALFLILGFSNTDGLIAKYNINAYENGSVKPLDTEMLYNLSDAVVPYVSDYYERTNDEKMKSELGKILLAHKDNVRVDEDGSFYTLAHEDGSVMRFNIQRYLAER